MHGLNEAWMLYVALQQGRIPPGPTRSQAKHIVASYAFLVPEQDLDAAFEDGPCFGLSSTDIALADAVLAKINKSPQGVAPGALKPIVDWFVANKKKITLGFNTMELSAAPMLGKNPGCVYLKVHDTYYGKITPQGNFIPATKQLVLSKSQMNTLLALAKVKSVEPGI